MPQAVTQIHYAAAQLAVAYVVLALLLLLASRQSVARLTAAPDFLEKAQLLRGARLHWFIFPLAGLVGLAIMLLVLDLFMLPLTALCANFLVVLSTLVVVIFRHGDSLDGLFAGLELRFSRDLNSWLQRHRARLQRRRKLGWLRYAMVALLALFVMVTVAGYVTVDRTLAVRLHSMGVAEQVQQELGPQAGTILSQTPPCVSLPTLYLIPTADISRTAAAAAADRLAQMLAQRQEKQQWRIVVKTGEGPPLAERQYP